jgi:aminoglycoside 2'-N-acetyltransferase I
VAAVRTAHTAELDRGTLGAVRSLLDAAFAGSFSDADWDHALGGVHALAWEGDLLVAHAAVVGRRLLHAGRALRTGYVEAVAVRADRRGRGHGAAVLGAVERVVRGAYLLGALSATDAGARLYERRGWRRWRGPTFALTPEGVVRTGDDDGSVHVLEAEAALDLDGQLTCDWRDGAVW